MAVNCRESGGQKQSLEKENTKCTDNERHMHGGRGEKHNGGKRCLMKYWPNCLKIA